MKDYTINIYAYILTFFENLQHLSIYGSSTTAYPGLSLCDLPSTMFFSLILTKLCINVSTFDDCLYLLDGRLHQLNTLIIRIYDINAPSLIVHNKVSSFSSSIDQNAFFYSVGKSLQFKMFFINMS